MGPLLRGILRQLPVRFVAAETSHAVEEAIIRHDADPAAAQAFASALTAAALSSALLDGEEIYTFRWQYPGTLQRITADVDSCGRVRGLPSQPHVMSLGSADQNTLYGQEDGLISVTKSENGRILNQGSAKAPLADPAADLGFFFSTSDQLESEFLTTVRFRQDPEHPVLLSVGVLLQALPDCDLTEFDLLRKKLHSSEAMEILLLPELTIQQRLEKLLKYLEVETDVIAEAPEIRFHCHCTRERMRQALTVMKPEELKDLFAQRNVAKVECCFCRKQHEFKKEEFFTE